MREEDADSFLISFEINKQGHGGCTYNLMGFQFLEVKKHETLKLNYIYKWRMIKQMKCNDVDL